MYININVYVHLYDIYSYIDMYMAMLGHAWPRYICFFYNQARASRAMAYGLLLWNYSIGLDYRIILRNNIMEYTGSQYGIMLRNYSTGLY